MWCMCVLDVSRKCICAVSECVVSDGVQCVIVCACRYREVVVVVDGRVI